VETRYGYCQCGCGQKTKIIDRTRPSKNHVKGEPYRRVAGHGNRKFNGPDYEVLENGCWKWLKCLSPEGYGRYLKGKGNQYSHRVYYEKAHGPIPKGMDLDHLCRNPFCVNPDHLEPVSHKENVRRGKATRLNARMVAEMKRRRSEGETYRSLAESFGVTLGYVCEIMKGRYWPDVPAEVKKCLAEQPTTKQVTSNSSYPP
jgi:hypothetical protein